MTKVMSKGVKRGGVTFLTEWRAHGLGIKLQVGMFTAPLSPESTCKTYLEGNRREQRDKARLLFRPKEGIYG